MLVLSFKAGETAVVQFPDGTEATVAVTDCSKSGRVRLGFDFPLNCVILRESIVDRERATEAPMAKAETSEELALIGHSPNAA